MLWLHEYAAPVAQLSPQTVNSTAKFSGVVDLARFAEVMFVFLLGDMANETIDLGLQQAIAESGPFSAISHKQATQLAASETANDNKMVVITLKSEELLGNNRYVRAWAVTGNTTGGPVAILALGRSRYGPSSDDASSAVVQIIV
ncbi:MAG: hypothetical protein SNJ75_08465 [Gemmataceae bacterium]